MKKKYYLIIITYLKQSSVHRTYFLVNFDAQLLKTLKTTGLEYRIINFITVRIFIEF